MIENYQESGVEAVKVVNFDAVRADLQTVMFDSQEVGMTPPPPPPSLLFVVFSSGPRTTGPMPACS